MLLVTQSGLIVCALVLGLLSVTGRVEIWHVMLFAGLSGIFASFDMPTRQSFVAEIVGKEDLPSAIALNSSIFNAARALGPAVAGLLLARECQHRGGLSEQWNPITGGHRRSADDPAAGEGCGKGFGRCITAGGVAQHSRRISLCPVESYGPQSGHFGRLVRHVRVLVQRADSCFRPFHPAAACGGCGPGQGVRLYGDGARGGGVGRGANGGVFWGAHSGSGPC